MISILYKMGEKNVITLHIYGDRSIVIILKNYQDNESE